jgi:hypothetical protein
MMQPARNALQMRSGADRPSANYGNAPAQSALRGSRPSLPVPVEQALVAATRPSGFGASALHDERVLDIPAYLRRGASQNHE